MRAGRSFAYGALAVVLADALAHRGFSALAIGALVTTALLAGAVGSVLTGPLARAYGPRATLAGGGVAMIAAAVLLAGPWWAIVLALGSLAAAKLSYIGVLIVYGVSNEWLYIVAGIFSIAFGVLVVRYPARAHLPSFG